MDIFQLKLEESAWYIIPCLLVATAYAYLLYRKNTVLTSNTKYLLGSLRFSAVFLICFLLLSPFINYTKNTFEKPVIAFVIDNSASIVLEQSSTLQDSILTALKITSSSLEKNEIETAFFDLNDFTSLDSLQFTNDETNLSEALKNTRDTYFNRNLAVIVLVSDGIYNRGTSPENLILNKPLYTLGLGDTTLQKDLAIQDIKTNKTAYIKNSFPIKTTIQHHGYAGQKVKVTLLEKDSTISTQELSLNSSGFQDITFYTSKSKVGIYNYTIKISELKEEITHKNNRKNVFVEIVNNKEKILLYALAPHPDIKTIRKIIDQLERYEFELFIDGISKSELKPQDYHLIITYQIPSIGIKGQFTDKVLNSTTPKLFVVGNQTDLRAFSSANKTLAINGNNTQKDEVNAYINSGFEKFKTDNNYINELLPNTPPIAVPFADYQIKGSTSGLLYQQVGSIQTDKPLLLLQQTNGFKEGVLIGEGYWRWAIFEYSEKQEHKLLDDILSKTIQFLISKEDKNKLIVKPKKQDFYTSETPSFEIQTLNDLSEPLSGIPVTVSISQGKVTKHKFDYVSDEFRQTFPMKNLEEGTYSYSSSATISNQNYRSEGAFTVKKKQLEEFDLQANHHLLKEISNNNNGLFYPFNKHTELVDELVSKNFKKVIHSQETNKPLRETWWYLLIIIALLTAEWILRKVKGSRI